MAYSSITKPKDYFSTVTYSGNATARDITTELTSTDLVWIKRRDGTANHRLTDVVRGATNMLSCNNNNATQTHAQTVTAFGTDTFTLGTDAGGYDVNTNSQTYVSWNWSAGGASPAVTYAVKVVSDSGNKYRFDDFGTSAVTLDLQEGGTYTFDQSDSSNSGHPLRFSTTSDGTHGGGSEYTTNVTTTGTPGSSGAQTVITVAASAPTLYYYCSSHSGMGGQANTNSTFGSSNFSGSIQSKVSANTTVGFSIITYTGTGSNATVGHGLSAVPKILIVKKTDGAANWYVYHEDLGNNKRLSLNETDAVSTDNNAWNQTTPTSSVFSIGASGTTNPSSGTLIAYCFAEKQGYSKFGSYTGNGNENGPFIYTGFKPAFVIVKNTATDPTDWIMIDNKRPGYNLGLPIQPNLSNAEGSSNTADLLSNGFKVRNQYGGLNGTVTTIYMAFAENPFVANDSGTAIPTTAR